MNLVILEGNLGSDPTVRFTADGKAVANLSMATHEMRGETKYTEWHRVVAFGKLAEVVEKYYKKGKQVLCQGRKQTRTWQDKEGNSRETVEIVAHFLRLLGAPDGSAPRASREAPPMEAYDDDIPF